MRHFMLDPKHDRSIIDVNMEIAQEDIDILVDLNPVRTPHTTTEELLVPADRPIVRYREFLRDWEQRGWRRRTLRDQRRFSAALCNARPAPSHHGRRSAATVVPQPELPPVSQCAPGTQHQAQQLSGNFPPAVKLQLAPRGLQRVFAKNA